jgi:MerR family transcriptional regulator, redox-sensitive transcriptional activator SoxR
MPELLTITEVSRRSGVASSALRFYEQRGLIRSERAGSGHRRYQRAVLRRIAFIVFAQKMGLHLEEIDERIAQLQRLRDGLTQCIGCGCLSLKQCQLANPADYAASLGPGPRYLLGDRRRLPST